ncbi:MAG TPA: glycosyltransferase [Pyrinomonadaceae bacterium]|nr:glycosyltransferase [Pyrinomonadaceae bacterium]
MKTLADFQNLHAGSTIIVCGCGESLNELSEPERFITIGVNDVGRRFHPNYLVVVNPPHQFSGDRFTYVQNSEADYVFSQLNLSLVRDNLVRFDLGASGGTDLSNPNVLHYTQNSPYVALCLAVHMGATRIGLIGVDFTDHHFFAATGTHSLLPQLPVIDEQYKNLYDAIRARGVEVFNLSSASRLTAFPKLPLAEFTGPAEFSRPEKKIFFVNYKFLSCGEVFTDGLRNAATSLGLNFQDAYWDDPQLAAKIHDFAPDWLFVVHGRRFVQAWRGKFPSVKKAVWLLDEPYEVDDTSAWSGEFNVVFVNDPNTLDRHRNAHYLPVAYDPEVHFENGNARTYNVGFIGGHNEVRERYLLALHGAGRLSYVVGGPWRSPALNGLCLAPNIPAKDTSELYRKTKIVVNVFREIHHFNRERVPAYSMNPRVYEALACGAVVVSEARNELSEVFPEVPLFSDTQQLLDTIGALESDEESYRTVKRACQDRLQKHSYVERLRRVLETIDCGSFSNKKESAMEKVQPSPLSLSGWKPAGEAVQQLDDGSLMFSKHADEGPATEQGIASDQAYRDVELAFEVKLERDACFIAKVRQASQLDQATNSYHLYCHPAHAYLARHNYVFNNVSLKREQWQQVKLRCLNNMLELEVDGVVVVSVVDGQLERGYCFVGCKSGKAFVRNLVVHALDQSRVRERASAFVRESVAPPNGLPDYRILFDTERLGTPIVSIVTTVYDRVNNLAECLRSVKELRYRDFEHIIVSDHPPEAVVDSIESLVKAEPTSPLTYADLNERANNWGIAPASVGLHLARGRYVCFLSDDNGYTPDHFDPLVSVLDQHSDIAFVYSSCQYAGRLVLRNSTPLPGGIDLGQPLFRKEIFDRYLPGRLPFDMMAWDWYMIETFMRHGLRWLHVDRPTFLFRLAACAQRELR